MSKRNSSGQDFTNNPDGWDLSGGTASRKLTVFGGDILITGAGSSFVYTFPAYTSNLMGATGISVNSIPKFTSISGFGNSSIYDDGIGVSIGIPNVFTSFPNHETLRISATGSTTSNSFNLVTGYGNVNNYLQLNIENSNGGPSASTDLVVTSNIGTETSYYVDMGINSSNWVGNGADLIGSGSDGYIYSAAKDFWIGNVSATYSMRFFAGGGTNSSAQGFEVMRINSTHVDVMKDLEIDGNIIDKLGFTGPTGGITTGSVLTSTNNGVLWSNPNGLNQFGGSVMTVQATSSSTLLTPIIGPSYSMTFIALPGSTYSLEIRGTVVKQSGALGLKLGIYSSSVPKNVWGELYGGASLLASPLIPSLISGTAGSSAFATGSNVTVTFIMSALIQSNSTATHSVALCFAPVTSGVAQINAGTRMVWTKL